MSTESLAKYRAAVEVLNQVRQQMIEGLADQVVDQADQLLDGGFVLQDFLESQGTRIQFASLLINQLETTLEALEDRERIRAQQSESVAKPESGRSTQARKPASSTGSETRDDL